MDSRKVMQVLNDPLGQELLHSNKLVRLAYNGRDGYPRVVPIGFYWNGTRIIICTATNAPKVRALSGNPKVALTIDTDTQPPHVLLVRGVAQIEIVDGVPIEYLQASKKGIPEQQWNSFEAQVRSLYKQMARIAIKPEWARLFDFETRLPDFMVQLAARKSDP
jgi:uncharacterized pyridoxamine 5'-phosphate oxidase family protein